MWRDRWFALGVIVAALACVACLTPLAALALGLIGLGAWTGRLDLVLLAALFVFVALAVYRYRRHETRNLRGRRRRLGRCRAVRLLPLAVIVLGLGSGAFMAVTMQYRWLFIPAGVIGVTTLYVRERRRCDALACRMAGGRITLALLMVAGGVVAASIALDLFPELTSDLLARVMNGSAPHAGHDMGTTR